MKTLSSRPNIVVCMADQLRWNAVGCYGNDFVQTPHLDALARESVRFETAVSPCPICMPARSALLAGQHTRTCLGTLTNAERGTDASSMPEYPFAPRHLNSPTLPELLKKAGYTTQAIGKWHVNAWPHEIGFDGYTIPRVHHCHSAQLFSRDGGPEFSPEGWSVDFEADEADSFFARQASSQRQAAQNGQEAAPFFLYYNISPPHCPVADAPRKYLEMYDPQSVPIPPNVDLQRPLEDQEHWFKVYRWDYRYYDFGLPFTHEMPEGYGLRHLFAEYYGLTTWVDDIVGRLRASLAANGLWENTIFVFTSDHGDNLGSHGLVQKGTFNDESIRVPFLWHQPDTSSADETTKVVMDQVANLVDIAPTLLDLTGNETPDHFAGQSLGPILRGETSALERDHTFIELGHLGVALRSPSHLYTLPWNDLGVPLRERTLGENPSQFFDVTRDPFQMENLAPDACENETADSLSAALRAWNDATPWRNQV